VLANAQHIRNVPGRKTGVNDAMRIADLLAHGLIRSSFVPPAPIQEPRDLTRTRKQVVREITQRTLRIQKVLEDANIKVGSALSSVMRRSGRALLDAIVAGEETRSASPGWPRARPARSTRCSSRRCAAASRPTIAASSRFTSTSWPPSRPRSARSMMPWEKPWSRSGRSPVS
jgi:hypothetical protein